MQQLPRPALLAAGLAALCGAPASLLGQGSVAPTSGVAERVRALVPALLRDAAVPGLALAVVEGGRLSWAGAFGVADAAAGAPVDTSTVFEAASLSKPVFAWAVLRLAEEGRIDLDVPLSDYLPAPYLNDPRLPDITARRVLTHTTGLPNWRPRGGPLALRLEPGERFSYSGEGYVYLQRVVEEVTGRPLDEVVRTLVFEPLDMPSSGYVWRGAYAERKAHPHDQRGERLQRQRPERANAAASLHTTAGDYGRFLAALLRADGLTPESFRLLRSPAVAVPTGCAVCVERPPSPDFDGVAWALGVGVETGASPPTLWHWGDNGPMKAFFLGAPASGRGVVYFANGENGLRLARPLVAAVLPGPHPAFDWLDYDWLPARR